MVLSTLSSLQDPEEWVYGAFSDYNLGYCNWILKRSIIPIVILIGSYQGFLIAEIDFFQLNPGTSTEEDHFMNPMRQ